MNNVQFDLVDLEGGSVSEYIKPKDLAEGDVIKGVYTSLRESEYKGKPTYTYYIEREDGTTIGLNGCGHLDFWMNRGFKGKRPIPFGHFVEITYKGTIEIEGNESHQFKVRASAAPVVTDLPAQSGATVQATSEKKSLKSKVDKLKKEIND
jgi:hypothetical protein